jgi:hypothetical protein
VFTREISGDVDNITACFAAEGASVRDRISRFAVRRAPRGVSFEIRRLNPSGSQCHSPITVRYLQRRKRFKGCASSLNLSGVLSRLVKVRRGDPTATASDCYQRVRRGVVIRETTLAKNYLGTNGLRRAGLDSCLLAGSVKVAIRKIYCDLCRGFSDGLPAGTSTQVSRKRPVHRFSET